MPPLRHAWLIFNPAWRSAWISWRIAAIWSGLGRFRMGRSLAEAASYTIPIKTGPDFGGQARGKVISVEFFHRLSPYASEISENGECFCLRPHALITNS